MKVTLMCVRVTIFAPQKQEILRILSVCLYTKHIMRHIIFSSVAYVAVLNFSHFLNFILVCMLHYYK
jgi:hypothetical protein